jgi:hypothetical protein
MTRSLGSGQSHKVLVEGSYAQGKGMGPPGPPYEISVMTGAWFHMFSNTVTISKSSSWNCQNLEAAQLLIGRVTFL